MALTPSTMLPLGTTAPDFTLPNPTTSGETSLTEVRGDAPALLVMFICNHCPYVIHVFDAIDAIAKDYAARGVAIVAINSNSLASHPQDGPDNMKRLASDRGWAFPFLFDPTQKIAHAYRAACTPDFYVFDGDARLTYRGRLDGSRPGSGIPCTGADLRAALDATLEGQPAAENQIPSMGCNIKWIPGNTPDYYG